MSKKQSKIKKAVKPSKAKPSSKSARSAGGKKIKPAKTVKKNKTKSAHLSGGTKANKKIVKKKPSAKKIANPAKKSVKKLVAKAIKPSKKVNKPVKGIVSKKIAKPVITIVKAAKKEKTPEVISKSEKSEKVLKPAKVEKEKPVKKVELFGAEVKKTPKRKKKKQKSEDDDEPVILEDILVEQLIQSTKRKAKQPKVPKILKTFVNPMTSLTVAVPAGKKGVVLPKKEPKGKFELEYVVRTSAGILYELLTTPSGLSEWFADDVNIRDGIFTFFWDGSEQKARLLGFKEDQYIRLQWMDKPEGYYFEFRIQKDELTGDISLMIIDFADEASDMQTSKLLWDSQVNKLLNVLGSN
jgi:hypothetical protein